MTGLACIFLGLVLHGAAWSGAALPDEGVVAHLSALVLTLIGPWFFPLDWVWRLMLSLSVTVLACIGACFVAMLVHVALGGDIMPTPGSGPTG